ncbi:unnamed protein product [Heligmosomoides polygyrus]|uniref:C-type lectin domain-containing protein n=1 Tax=Heligmosomoides polygyrus TaxID=6339 RepID=A0A3P7ZKQ3_HELPZ|nr:unnamed protein product [Heligmosomoides polygyrus]
MRLTEDAAYPQVTLVALRHNVISAAGEREWKARDCEIENKPKANYYICERVNQAYYAYNKLVYQEEEECSNTLPFMCQIQKAHLTPENWNRAAATCAKEGGRLVQIQSGKEVKYLRDNMPSNFGEPYWIGLQKEGGAYKWKKPGNDVSYAVSKLANRKSEGDKDRCYMVSFTYQVRPKPILNRFALRIKVQGEQPS